MKNVVLVSIDSLRADHCGFMGYEKDTTPTLDSMAADGLTFENAIAPGPSTYESMPAIVTGEHMSTYPVDSADEDAHDNRNSLIETNTRKKTIAEWFDEHEYTTGAFTTNPYTGSHTNFARGFDYYEDFMDGGEGPLMKKAADLPVLSELRHVVTLVRRDLASKPWQEYYQEIIGWAEQALEPYFLWVFVLDPHTPYLPPGAHRGSSKAEMYYWNWKLWADKKWGVDLSLDAQALETLYDSAIKSTDAFLSALQEDLPGDPVFSVHADHGEAFGEHGDYGHYGHIYEENLHVPWVISNVDVAGTVEHPVSLTALPSVLQGAATDSITVPSPDLVFAKTLGPKRVAVRDGAWKYIAEIDTDVSEIVGEELYDLESDPHERRDRTDDELDRTVAYRQRIKRQLTHENEVAAIYQVVPEIA